MSSYPPIGEQIEGRPNLNPVHHSQKKSFWNKTTLKVSALSIAITAFIGAIFSVEVGLIALTVSFTAYVINHYTNREEKIEPEFRLELNNKNERAEEKSNPHMYSETSDALPMQEREVEDYTNQARGCLGMLGYRNEDAILKRFDLEFNCTQARKRQKRKNFKNEDDKAAYIDYISRKKHQIETFIKDLVQTNSQKNFGRFRGSTIVVDQCKLELSKALLDEILSPTIKDENQKRLIIDTAINQQMMTPILGECLFILLIEKPEHYALEKLSVPIGFSNYYIYNFFELFIAYLRPRNRDNYCHPSDSSRLDFSIQTRTNGLHFFGISDRRWNNIKSVSKHKRISDFFKNMKHALQPEATQYNEQILEIYGKSIPTDPDGQPGLNSPFSQQGEGLGLGMSFNTEYVGSSPSSSIPLRPASGEGHTPRSPSPGAQDEEVEI